MGNVLSTYIFLLAGNSYETLGLLSAATGLSMTLVVFPAGFLADRFRRDWMLKIAGVIGIMSLGVIMVAEEINLIMISLILWGAFQGINRPSLEAIFADSVPSRTRSRVYSWNHLTRQFAMATGPFLNVLLFYIIGNQWTLANLRKVMIAGIIISLLSVSLLFFFDDDKALKEASEAVKDVEMPVSPNLPRNVALQRRSVRIVPYILVASNIIIGFGAGMTVKYFPLFFIRIYSLLPIDVQLIMGFTSIATGLSSITAQRLSIKNGRPQLIFIVQSLATLCLFLIAFYPPLWLLVPLFIVRGSFMNASQPLSRSILMDLIPKHSRGKWNSVEAIAWGLFWNVSSAIGGFLIGSEDNFRLVFLVTAALYTFGTSIILFIVPLVPSEVFALEEKELQPIEACTGEVLLRTREESIGKGQ